MGLWQALSLASDRVGYVARGRRIRRRKGAEPEVACALKGKQRSADLP